MSDINIGLLERQYKLAIDARDKLNDNFYKWMSYYYLANAGVLVAITNIYKDGKIDKGVFILSLIGLFISILWHFSCKGYYYWSQSWIDIIILFEKKMKLDNSEAVYSIFSKRVAEKDDKFWNPISSANISTPKLTLLFSFISILCWMTYSIYLINVMSPQVNFGQNIVLISMFLLISFLLPIVAKSRKKQIHILVDGASE